MTVKQADCKYWDTIPFASFLADDKDNPQRTLVAKVVAEEVEAGACTMLEVGPGSGICFRDHLQHIDGLRYLGLEGAPGRAAWLASEYGESNFQHGTFATLEDRKADIIYTRATLEHQPDFRDPLAALLRAAEKLLLVSWYLPPAASENISYWPSSNIYGNRYREADVLDFIRQHGWGTPRKTETRRQGEQSNCLWEIRK